MFLRRGTKRRPTGSGGGQSTKAGPKTLGAGKEQQYARRMSSDWGRIGRGKKRNERRRRGTPKARQSNKPDDRLHALDPFNCAKVLQTAGTFYRLHFFCCFFSGRLFPRRRR